NDDRWTRGWAKSEHQSGPNRVDGNKKIARAGFAAIYAVSSTPTVVPPGALRKALGTNPLAIALPRKGDPFIFDMGTASVMSGEVLMKAFLGEEFPEIVGIDKNGAPTRLA